VLVRLAPSPDPSDPLHGATWSRTRSRVATTRDPGSSDGNGSGHHGGSGHRG
jgi:hypothetical protein